MAPFSDHGGPEGWSAIIAHQLKTPLCALDAKLAGRGQLERDLLRRDIQRLTHLIDQLQTLGQCQDGGPGQIERPPLAEVVRRICVSLLPLALTRDQIVVLRDLSGEARPAIRTDLVGEAVSNLVENALKYAPDGSQVTVVVTARPAIHVLDRGPGVSQPHDGTIFQPFRRGRLAAKSTSGTGLGLYVADRVMRRHGGELSHRSRRGGGTTFTMTFPPS
ncbi:MAG: HAMP domain-containing sensor histidine kinase [Pseudomonadota bacterium]